MCDRSVCCGRVIFIPDAGSTDNPDTILTYMTSVGLLEKWGMRISFWWWGQHSKDDSLDGDVLLAADDMHNSDSLEISDLSVKQFWDLCAYDVQKRFADEGSLESMPEEVRTVVGHQRQVSAMQEAANLWGKLT